MTAADPLLDRVASYYSARLRAHGPTAAGVDWKSSAQQSLRFEQLLKLCGCDTNYSLLDYGCGYGALLTHMRAAGNPCRYVGYDICPEMISAAEAIHGVRGDHRFVGDEALLDRADYAVASGIFNVMDDANPVDWTRHVHDTLDRLAGLCRKGIAFNALTTHVDYRRPDLYYADPAQYFTHCAKRYSRRVAVYQDYGLYEFTLIVRL